MKKSEIKFVITLDKENIPEKIEWIAEDSLSDSLSETKSISLSLWDEKKKNNISKNNQSHLIGFIFIPM